ncbi:ATP-binding protein [Sphaerisporangium krabiense]|uniref:Anti-sigma regulatory factor (Ser/Thr protein kinase) n=1 Tax=Sphaerisporangium krabiense TaxID=763782 RepID=A0A7W8YZX0_9ACTN|nr:ATP-binding protein [Sphaerisporangium krabiense]MBB5624821.1 anti-sigma regulatory factor (Ser/Thr protein kinase) [Sphaerisporangium krabiense]
MTAMPEIGVMATADLLGRVELPGRAASVGLARAFVREILRTTRCQETDDAVLMVSELVTNAIRYSGSGRRPDGRLAVVLTDHGRAIQVDVIDEGASAHPYVHRDVGESSEGGRGLWLVCQLASAWGWRADPDGHVVWFQMSTI